MDKYWSRGASRVHTRTTIFFIYINDLSDDLSTNAKLFVDDTSLLSVVRDINTSAIHLNNDLREISN